MTAGGSTWALANFGHQVAERFNATWTATPYAVRRRWAVPLLIGLAAVFVVLFGLIALGNTTLGEEQRFAWETSALQWLERNSGISFNTAIWLQTLGTDFTLIFLVLSTSMLAIWTGRPLLALNILLSLAVMDAAVRIGWLGWERARPNIIAEGLASPELHSFPSGHTSRTLAVYGLLAFQWIRISRSKLERIIVLLLALVIVVAVPYGRVRIGAHWPTDVIGGYLIGGVWLAALMVSLRETTEHTE